MGGNVAFYITPEAAAIFLGVSEHFVKRPVIQMVFQFVGKIRGLWRLVLRAPFRTVILFPFPLESVAVASSRPEFRFLHEYGIHSCVNHTLNVALFHVFKEVFRGDDIRHHMAVPDGIAPLRHLPFVKMPFAIPFACEIVLVFPPRYTGHEMHRVATVFPALHTILESLFPPFTVARVTPYPIDHNRIGTVVYRRAPLT